MTAVALVSTAVFLDNTSQHWRSWFNGHQMTVALVSNLLLLVIAVIAIDRTRERRREEEAAWLWERAFDHELAELTEAVFNARVEINRLLNAIYDEPDARIAPRFARAQASIARLEIAIAHYRASQASPTHESLATKLLVAREFGRSAQRLLGAIERSQADWTRWKYDKRHFDRCYEDVMRTMHDRIVHLRWRRERDVRLAGERHALRIT